jgi:hypothetical protein
VSGRESVHGAVPASAALAKPVVVAVPVHSVTDPRAKCMPERSHSLSIWLGDHAFRVDRRPVVKWPGTAICALAIGVVDGDIW